MSTKVMSEHLPRPNLSFFLNFGDLAGACFFVLPANQPAYRTRHATHASAGQGGQLPAPNLTFSAQFRPLALKLSISVDTIATTSWSDKRPPS